MLRTLVLIQSGSTSARTRRLRRCMLVVYCRFKRHAHIESVYVWRSQETSLLHAVRRVRINSLLGGWELDNAILLSAIRKETWGQLKEEMFSVRGGFWFSVVFRIRPTRSPQEIRCPVCSPQHASEERPGIEKGFKHDYENISLFSRSGGGWMVRESWFDSILPFIVSRLKSDLSGNQHTGYYLGIAIDNGNICLSGLFTKKNPKRSNGWRKDSNAESIANNNLGSGLQALILCL